MCSVKILFEYINMLFILNQCLFWALELEAEIKGKMTRIPGGWQCTECPMNSKYTTTVRNREVNWNFGTKKGIWHAIDC